MINDDEVISQLKEILKQIESAARHIYYADACRRDGNMDGYTQHLRDALFNLGVHDPKDVRLSQKMKFYV